MNIGIGSKQRTWLHAIVAKSWMVALVYFSLLIYVVLFTPGRSDLHEMTRVIHAIPFTNSLHSFERLSDNHSSLFVCLFLFTNLLGNVLIFIPLPLVLYYACNIRSHSALIACAASLSLGIETLQYCFQAGIPDVDDLICNTTGGITGAYLHGLLLKYNKIATQNSIIHENRPHKI